MSFINCVQSSRVASVVAQLPCLLFYGLPRRSCSRSAPGMSAQWCLMRHHVGVNMPRRMRCLPPSSRRLGEHAARLAKSQRRMSPAAYVMYAASVMVWSAPRVAARGQACVPVCAMPMPARHMNRQSLKFCPGILAPTYAYGVRVTTWRVAATVER